MIRRIFPSLAPRGGPHHRLLPVQKALVQVASPQELHQKRRFSGSRRSVSLSNSAVLWEVLDSSNRTACYWSCPRSTPWHPKSARWTRWRRLMNLMCCSRSELLAPFPLFSPLSVSPPALATQSWSGINHRSIQARNRWKRPLLERIVLHPYRLKRVQETQNQAKYRVSQSSQRQSSK